MLQLPRIIPNRVDRYALPKRNLESFVSDAGLQTRIAHSCRSFGLTLNVEYNGLKPSEMGELLCWQNDLDYDGEGGFSLRHFRIPANHPLWDKVSVLLYLPKIMIADSLDDALWLMRDASEVSVPFCNLHDFSFKVEEVYL